jgi:hypothetical protein
LQSCSSRRHHFGRASCGSNIRVSSCTSFLPS